MSNIIIATYKIKLHFFPILLIYPIYTTSFYFTIARGKLPPIFTLNTLELMIECTLISSIMDRICEMTTKPWDHPRYDIQLLPFQHLLHIITWGSKWKRVIDKTNEWAAWQWANVEINKKSFGLLKQIVNISKTIWKTTIGQCLHMPWIFF
jgi:hypothetical protein